MFSPCIHTACVDTGVILKHNACITRSTRVTLSCVETILEYSG